jgi:hypothetical protein
LNSYMNKQYVCMGQWTPALHSGDTVTPRKMQGVLWQQVVLLAQYFSVIL